MSLGIGQILIILIVVFVVFGAGKLPSVMSDFAKGIRAFKKGLQDDDDDSSQQSPVQTMSKPLPRTPLIKAQDQNARDQIILVSTKKTVSSRVTKKNKSGVDPVIKS